MNTVMINGIIVTMNPNMDVFENGYVVFRVGKFRQWGLWRRSAAIWRSFAKRAG